ncbi:DUF4199 domain-containing protein [Chitinophaga sp. XS-30]|uniref:DUF4199 domain-containing protein n=1 Tax=Chitinophaga sp. XS-30 TaxID=2604421 RepID=UPI0011DD19B8|nr:DUF4199 domain-containing protein [Chitinophaga sp. XS-30]QEH42028.1 DUF4199 domain-containing protein [Chitinophaga sp. XS-30]
MKKNVIVFGLISGLILTVLMVTSTVMCYRNENFEGNMVLGYAAMLLAFSLIFVGIKNYRDKFNGGLITFGKAFRIGMFISLIASSMYVLVWLVEYYVFIPDFMDKYIPHVMNAAREDGATAAELEKKAVQMADFKEMYRNPLFVVLISYFEVLPIGLAVSLICAWILRRNRKDGEVLATAH